MDSGFRSVVAYPLLVDRTPIGALMLTSYDVGALDQIQEELAKVKDRLAELQTAGELSLETRRRLAADRSL